MPTFLGLTFNEAQDDGWQWHQLDNMQSSAPRTVTVTMPTPHHLIFTDRMLFLAPNQCRSIEGKNTV